MMAFLLQLLLLIVVLMGLAFYRTPIWVWIPVTGLTLLGLCWLAAIPIVLLTIFTLVFVVTAVTFVVKSLRMQWLSKPLYRYVRKVLPAISQTEREALDSGDVWLDRDIFQGRINWTAIYETALPTLTADERQFLDEQVENLCRMTDDWQDNQQRHSLSPKAWEYIKEQGFLGLIIDRKHGGKQFSTLAHSDIVTRLGSRSINLGVSVMVPNSLGPAELLMEYGTQQQKDYFLPRLASGEEIPCFALTAPEAGSDASSIPDLGVVCEQDYQGQPTLGIRLTIDKRYITLAPIATLIGVAFQLKDPDDLLKKGTERIGITVALIPADLPGIEIGNRHIPLYQHFMNGTIRAKDVFIPLDWILGGRKMAGKGWQVLMESLSIGRSISLPALSTASINMSYRMTAIYARIRDQFNLPIGLFEGVQEVLARIAGKAYIVNATRLLTVSAVEQGLKPAIVSAVAKYHMSEMARASIQDAMDIHAGRGIQAGPGNYILPNYMSIPIAITVEGANILTRNLIIFGQGAIRAHPYIREEMRCVAQTDQAQALHEFDQLIRQHIGYFLQNTAKSLLYGLTHGHASRVPKRGRLARYHRQLNQLSASLAFVADASLIILGGTLKRKERLSARLGDVLSHIYLGIAVLKYYHEYGNAQDDLPLVEWALQYCIAQARQAFREFFRNFPRRMIGIGLRMVAFPLGCSVVWPEDTLDQQVAHSMLYNTDLRDRLTDSVYVSKTSDDATGLMEYASAKLISAQAALDKLRQLGKQGQLDKSLTLTAQAERAHALDQLNDEEKQTVIEFDEVRKAVIAVDEFSFASLQADDSNPPITTTKEERYVE
jgi:acyl-CoA dehydrogenase